MSVVSMQKWFDRLFEHRLERRVQAVFRLYSVVRPVREPIFIIGSGRSGTTIFMTLMSQRQDIVNWSEANPMWDPVGYPWEADRIKRPFESLDAQGYADSVLESAGEFYYRAIPGMCSMYMSAYGEGYRGRHFMNKSPMNTLRVKVLRRIFPDARFISLIRDPRAVIRSWMAKNETKLNHHPHSKVETNADGEKQYLVDGVRYTYAEMLAGVCRQYTYIVQQQIEQSSHLAPDRHRLIRYEDFADDVCGTLRAVDAHFGLSPDLRRWDETPAKLENRNYKYKQEYTQAEIDTIWQWCRPIFDHFGYQREP